MKFKNSKKTQLAPEYLIIFFLIAVIIFLLVFIPIKTGDKIKGKLPKDICKASVYAAAGLHIKGDDFSADINCPTQDITIKGYKDDAKRQIANAMYDCWDQFGQGKLELFQEEQVYCAVCHRLRFEDKGEPITDISDFLFKENAPFPNNHLKYADFLAGYATPEAEKYAKDILSLKGDDTIDPNNIYATLFIYAKGKDSISNLKDALGSNSKAAFYAGAAGGVAGGLVALYFVSNPIGWVSAGIIAVGVIAGGTVSAIFTYFAGEPPEWMALTVLTEYTPENLLEFKCAYLPASQNQPKE